MNTETAASQRLAIKRLEIRDLVLRAGQHHRGRLLCQQLNLQLEAGQNWAVLGPNGSGKSSLLRTLAGLDAPADGVILANDRPLQHFGPREKARLVGMVTQDSDDRFPVTVLDAALAGRYPHHVHAWYRDNDVDRQRALAALEAVDLRHMSDRTLDQLSGGERRRVDIAALLTQDPPLCLMDEPTNHLDLKHQHDALSLLAARTERAGTLNVFVLHDINAALRHCDHVLMMFADGTQQAGPARELLTASNLHRLYGLGFRAVPSVDGNLYLPE